jgi:hypothetical protein
MDEQSVSLALALVAVAKLNYMNLQSTGMGRGLSRLRKHGFALISLAPLDPVTRRIVYVRILTLRAVAGYETSYVGSAA